MMTARVMGRYQDQDVPRGTISIPRPRHWKRVLYLPELEAAMTVPRLLTTMTLSRVMPISRTRKRMVTHHQISWWRAAMIKAEQTRSLSAMGSISLPSSVTWL